MDPNGHCRKLSFILTKGTQILLSCLYDGSLSLDKINSFNHFDRRKRMEKLRRAFFRTKHFTQSEVDSTALKRKLSTLDLTALGVGNVVGAGIYVIAGIVAREQTGPAIVISFAIGALVCCLSGIIVDSLSQPVFYYCLCVMIS